MFELPVVGSGDGGAHSTVADLHRFWRALRAGRILPREFVPLAIQPTTEDADDGMGYGRGVWLDDGDLLMAGSDHGVAVVSRHDPATGITVSALANIEVPTFARTKAAMQTVRDRVGRAD